MGANSGVGSLHTTALPHLISRRPSPRVSVKPRWANQMAVSAALMMVLDVLAVLLALYLALGIVYGFNASLASSLAHGGIVPPHVGYLVWFITALLFVNRRYGLYGSIQNKSGLHEQRRTLQACLTAGFLLCGGIYMAQDATISRAVVVYMVGLSGLFLCTVRAVSRHSRHRRYAQGLQTRNVIILGSSHFAERMREQIVGSKHLGRVFKGFVQEVPHGTAPLRQGKIALNLRNLRDAVKLHFVDEIIIADCFAESTILELVEIAREMDVELLVMAGFSDDMRPGTPLEYLGDFPVVALHRRHGRVLAHLLKRTCDFLLSLTILLIVSPLLLLIAIAVKLDSQGPIFYVSERIGRKGRSFRCFKFRTMVADAERLKEALASMNERTGVLFKIKNDPRVTRVGRLLRKYSLDELPQILNVLCGEMSLVGPRPPVASEVEQYELDHFRRLEVLPGLTGLWQVRARQDPSFERYVALDLAYVENWSLWLDLKILISTADVVLRGTGS